ncbi:MAG: copper homeostasis protein CutC [Salinivirgaceae bacterium]|jgi:copper homeostasis protein|nr:copper homeostasis protein CutC [Salinivirgaceae bacterium]
MILEICCYTAESALLAATAGAHRIELCDNYSEGGTTPSFGTIKQVVEQVSIPVNVIVRPRGGDFLYSNYEYEIIKDDVEQIKKLRTSGIVIGFLNRNGEIDINRTTEIAALAAPLEVTFHRAFDMCANHITALNQLKNIGINRILTSGGKNSASEGAQQIANLIRKAGNDIIIMPGSGINDTNISKLIKATGAKEFHCSAKTFIDSKMHFTNTQIQMGGKQSADEYQQISVNTEQIKNMVKTLCQGSKH